MCNEFQVGSFKFEKISRGVLQYALNNLYKTVGQASRLSMHHPLSSWRERVRACPVLDTGVRGINLYAILDTQYDIRYTND